MATRVRVKGKFLAFFAVIQLGLQINPGSYKEALTLPHRVDVFSCSVHKISLFSLHTKIYHTCMLLWAEFKSGLVSTNHAFNNLALRKYSVAHTGLSIRPGTCQSSGGYSVIKKNLLCLDHQLNVARMVLNCHLL